MRKVLVLQGGGALGAYQAGAYEALAEAGQAPDWLAGTSIGAINAAIIAGNPPERRVERLREFWHMVSAPTALMPMAPPAALRAAFEAASAGLAAGWGVPGFFRPRVPPVLGEADPTEVSLYDTSPLRDTLLRLVDFDRLNTGPVRLSVGAVEVETGNLAYFDNRTTRIGPEHIMASGALPPGFAPVRIDGRLWWDGGLVSNSPLQHVLDTALHESLGAAPGGPFTIYQVDLFSAAGAAPRRLADIEAREKDIRFSSRTRANTDRVRELHDVAVASRRLAARLPPEWRDDPDLRHIMAAAAEAEVTVVHLIYRPAEREGGARDYEFSRPSIEERWAAGLRDVRHTHAHAAWTVRRAAAAEGAMRTLDLTRD